MTRVGIMSELGDYVPCDDTFWKEKIGKKVEAHDLDVCIMAPPTSEKWAKEMGCPEFMLYYEKLDMLFLSDECARSMFGKGAVRH